MALWERLRHETKSKKKISGAGRNQGVATTPEGKLIKGCGGGLSRFLHPTVNYGG